MNATEDVLTSVEAGGRVIRGSVLRLGGSLAGILAGVVTATLLLRHLGVAESGRYVTVTSLVAIASTVADAGLNVTGSRDLALRAPDRRRALLANLLGLRMVIAPIGLLAVVAFAVVAGYPSRMVIGTALAGVGMFMVAVQDAVLLPLTVELRNGSLALVDLVKQLVTVTGVALLVALNARLTPFFAVQIAVGLAVVGVTPLLVGRRAFLRPRFDRSEQRALVSGALPVAAAYVLGQVYFRIVMLIMSLVASAQQTGYFGGSLRAVETFAMVPVMIAGIVLPVLTAAARDDVQRLRYALQGLTEVALIGGAGLILVTIRAAQPAMEIIGGHQFRAAGAVLRIQIAALVFIALSQIWAAGLISLHRQRDLIVTNGVALLCVGAFAAVLVPASGAQGGAAATVLGDAALAALVYWRLRGASDAVRLRFGVLGKVLVATPIASLALLIPGLPDLVAAGLAGVVYLGVGRAIGMLPDELPQALGRRGRRAGRG